MTCIGVRFSSMALVPDRHVFQKAALDNQDVRTTRNIPCSKANPAPRHPERCECPGASLRMRPVHQIERDGVCRKNERRLVRFKQSRERLRRVDLQIRARKNCLYDFEPPSKNVYARLMSVAVYDESPRS